MKKIISVALVAVMLIGCLSAFAACAPTKDPNTLYMATNAAFPPYEYKDGNGYAGIDVEIAQAIAAKLGKKLEIADIDFGSIIAGVETGKYDFGMAGLTVTEKRKESVNFSTTYATGIQVIIVKEGSDIASIDDIFEFDDNDDPVVPDDNDEPTDTDGTDTPDEPENNEDPTEEPTDPEEPATDDTGCPFIWLLKWIVETFRKLFNAIMDLIGF